MIANDPDKEWEKFGKDNPYFGVISHGDYAKDKLSPESLKRFFDTGEKFIQLIFDHMRAHVHPEFKPETALDFGCGVGRLAIPLASRCRRVVGIDVSPSMLKEAEKNCREKNIGNAEFFTGLDALGAERRFDFINTFIVMQHILPEKGMHIFRGLLARLAPGGCGAIHLTYHGEMSRPRALVIALRKRVHVFNMLANLAKGLPPSTPLMQMNSYNLNAVFWELQKSGCGEFHSLFTDHGGHAGQLILFRKPASPAVLKA